MTESPGRQRRSGDRCLLVLALLLCAPSAALAQSSPSTAPATSSSTATLLLRRALVEREGLRLAQQEVQRRKTVAVTRLGRRRQSAAQAVRALYRATRGGALRLLDSETAPGRAVADLTRLVRRNLAEWNNYQRHVQRWDAREADLARRLNRAEQTLAATTSPQGGTSRSTMPTPTAAPITASMQASLALPRWALHNGQLALPVDGDLAAAQPSLAASLPSSGLMRQGIFLSLPAGSALRAVAAGTVVAVSELDGLAHVVVVEHRPGEYAVYGGLADVSVVQGAKLQPRQVIGHTPRSSSRNHLAYYDVRQALSLYSTCRLEARGTCD